MQIRSVKSLFLLGLALFSSFTCKGAGQSPEAPRERLLFNSDWRFHLGDPQWMAPQFDYPVVKRWILPSANHLLAASSTKSARPEGSLGSDLNCIQAGYDDSAWRVLNLPHDWGIEGPFRQELPGDTGKLPFTGAGWYRKTFHVATADAGQRFVLELDGAMASPLVWLNGQFVGGWAYGYSSFHLDLTEYIRPGEQNILAIRLENFHEASRWYPGSGLYRNVWLTKTGPLHVAQWGCTVTTPEVSVERALVCVEVRTCNKTRQAEDLQLVNEIYPIDPETQRTGECITKSQERSFKSPAQRECSVSQTIALEAPRLWSPAAPNLYLMVSTLRRGETVVDRVETRFGIRSAVLHPDKGLLVNGTPLRIQGVCLHHDLGALGTAINERAIERQLEILREMGCNAIRTSHNPPAPELLDACDRMGFLVFDEAFDCWQKGKGRNDYHRYFEDWHEADLRALVRRDKNHPSVIMWSIGNEVVEQWGDDSKESWKLAQRLCGIIREEDRTRPISGAFNNGDMGFNGVQHAVDAIGYNYRTETYKWFREANPSIPLFGSETASTLSTRGEYFFPVSDDKLSAEARVNFQVSSYDLYAEAWASQVEEEWRAADAVSGYAGEFVWTGFDYLGEPTPFNSDATNLLNFSSPEAKEKMARQLAELGRIQVPSRSSYFGIVDLAGLPKDRYYLYQSRWRPELPMAHILPHWTWPGREGLITPVHVYTSGDEAELFLNKRSLGRKKKESGSYRLRWDEVKYAPGELRVVSYKHGARWAEASVLTAGDATQIKLVADRKTLHANGTDLVYVTVDIGDSQGNLCPHAANSVRFTIQGPGQIIATDNGDPTSFESFQSSERKVFHGKAIAIIRSIAGQTGSILIRAESKGLQGAETIIDSIKE